IEPERRGRRLVRRPFLRHVVTRGFDSLQLCVRHLRRWLIAGNPFHGIAEGKGKLDRSIPLVTRSRPLEAGEPPKRFRGEPPVLWARPRHLAPPKGLENLLEPLSSQVLVVVLADQGHRCVRTGAETLHLLPGELA